MNDIGMIVLLYINKCLREVYGYRRERIFVIMSDGKSESLDQRHLISGGYSSSPQDLDGDGTDDINYSATRTNISTVFSFLGNHVTQDEQVLIFVSDHGDRENGKSYIWLWDNNRMSADDFAVEVNKINPLSRKHIVMGQCYSGGFISPLSSCCSNISIATAASAEEESHSKSDRKYDEFLYNWISAAMGKTPEGQLVNAENDGRVGISVKEMFDYASRMRTWNETPLFASVPETLGDCYGLQGENVTPPELIGPYDISSSSDNNTFELQNMPSNASVTWTSSDNIRLTSVGSVSVNVSNKAAEAMEKGWVQAVVNMPSDTYILRERVYLWKPGWHTTEILITGSLQESTFSLPYCVLGCNEYNWYISSRDYDDVQAESYFIDFTYTGDGDSGDYYVSVNFLNPLGEDTTIVRWYQE